MTTTAATRPPEYTSVAPLLHLAFELGQSTWKLGFTTGLGQRPRAGLAADGDGLADAPAAGGPVARTGGRAR